jgi:inosine/xanthosine triphosphate pyrophosphatase family protein
MTDLRLNTSNLGKLAEFQRLFGSSFTLEIHRQDLKEIDSTPMDVVVHKATSCGMNVLIEDTSLDVEGAEVGVNVRWLLENLASLAGRGATWRVMLGVLREDGVHVFMGEIKGTITLPRGEGGFGFDPIFLPEGEEFTLAQVKPDRVSARAKAVEAFKCSRSIGVFPPIENWQGKWQH